MNPSSSLLFQLWLCVEFPAPSPQRPIAYSHSRERILEEFEAFYYEVQLLSFLKFSFTNNNSYPNVVDDNPQPFQLFPYGSRTSHILRVSSGLIRSLPILMGLRVVVTFFRSALTTTPEPS